MPMGIVSDEDFLKERDNTSPDRRPLEKPTIVDMNRGRPTGSVEVPDGLRRIIGETSVTDGRQEALALGKNFGISSSSVSAYANGATSTSSYNETPNRDVIRDARGRITRKAMGKLSLALKNLTPEVIASAKAKDIAGIAKDMSAVIRSMEEKSSNDNSGPSGPTFIFYSPQTRKEETFDVVFTKEG